MSGCGHHIRELTDLFVVDIVLEAEIFRSTQFRLPTAGAALVVAKRGDVARQQLFGELLQRRRLDLRSIAVMIGRARARDQQRNRRPLDARRDRQDGVDAADGDPAFLSAGVDDGHGNREQDCKCSSDGAHAHVTRSSAPLPAA